VNTLFSTDVSTKFGSKTIAVVRGNVLDYPEPIDILTTSAYKLSYHPTPGTLFAALETVGISVDELACEPLIDLRSLANVWLSQEVVGSRTGIRRIGCVEMGRIWSNYSGYSLDENALLTSLKAYFRMLDVASMCDVRMETVALPLLGAGRQRISGDLTLIPIINECVEFLKRNEFVRKILFLEMNPERAMRIAQALSQSYSLFHETVQKKELAESCPKQPLAFISYSGGDRNVADNLCHKLESRGVKVWYAPRDVQGPYAEAITIAIREATHFVVILSQNSMESQHVLNEVDLAFKALPNHIKFKPLRIDLAMFRPAFEYYLSRQHWMDAYLPPLEDRLNEFVDKFVAEL
jgi:hypothetical protein